MPATNHPIPSNDDIDQAWPGAYWLRASPIEFVRTAPFMALIAGLHELLNNPFVSDRQAYIAVRRAARLLNAFVEEAERKPRPGDPAW